MRIGRIPPASVFAGQLLDLPLDGGSLVRCAACDLTFRTPVHEPAFYDAMYARASAKEWERSEVRTDHGVIVAALQRHASGGDVLDIGCGSGALLDLLPPAFRRFGIEIGIEARRAAAARGVDLVGSSFDDVGRLNRQFDVVLACDVVEHQTQPLNFIRSGLSIVRPGGLLILSTGNARAALWRLTRGRFWYCQFAEHLSFISPAWIRRHAVDYAVVEQQTFRYGARSAMKRVKGFLRLAHYLAAPRSYARQVERHMQWSRPDPLHPNPPGLGLTADHFVAVLKRRVST